MNKKDPRYINAEKKIFDAVFELFPKRDIESIKTQTIIAKAGIHKSTFYSHYRDKYALIEALVDVAAQRLTPHLESITLNMLGSDANDLRLEQSYNDLALSISENRTMLLVILQGSMERNLVLKIVSALENIWKENGIADPESWNIAYIINAAAFVTIGTIEKWLQRECLESVESLARLISVTGEGLRNAFALL